jgi:hypothetical protein
MRNVGASCFVAFASSQRRQAGMPWRIAADSPQGCRQIIVGDIHGAAMCGHCRFAWR